MNAEFPEKPWDQPIERLQEKLRDLDAVLNRAFEAAKLEVELAWKDRVKRLEDSYRKQQLEVERLEEENKRLAERLREVSVREEVGRAQMERQAELAVPALGEPVDEHLQRKVQELESAYQARMRALEAEYASMLRDFSKT